MPSDVEISSFKVALALLRRRFPKRGSNHLYARLGWVSTLQGDDERALTHYYKALVICQLNEPQRGNSGESARVKWRISQIFERKGMMKEAKALLDAANETKASLLATGDYATVQDKDASWDALLGLLYR